MTPEQLQMIRHRDAEHWAPYQYAIDGQRGCEDRRALLAHVDALQEQLLPLLSEHSRYSTALETISAMGCDGDGAGDTCSCAPCRADEALTGSEELSEIAVRDEQITRLTSELDAARAEVERLCNPQGVVFESLNRIGVCCAGALPLSGLTIAETERVHALSLDIRSVIRAARGES